MRVLHVIPSIAPRYGGPSAAVLGMCRALGASSVDAVVATTDADGPRRLPLPLGVPASYQGIPAILFRRQWSEAFKYSRPLARWLQAHVVDFDLVHIHAVFSHASVAAAAASHRHGIPYVVSPHGTLDPWSMRQKPVRKWIMWQLGARRVLAQAAAVHYTTDEERRLAEESLGLSHGAVIPLGLDAITYAAPADLDRFRRELGLGEHPYVLVLSRLHPKKALGPFISAFLDLTAHQKFRRWRLVIAGEGDAAYKTELQRLVEASSNASANGAQRVIFPGWLDGPDKLRALHGASLMALPSFQENFGISVAESLVCGVPVLVSTGVNLAEYITAFEAGWVVPLDPISLANGLADALSDKDERVRRGRAGRQLVLERFSWPAVAAQLLELYTTVVTGPVPGNR